VALHLSFASSCSGVQHGRCTWGQGGGIGYTMPGATHDLTSHAQHDDHFLVAVLCEPIGKQRWALPKAVSSSGSGMLMLLTGIVVKCFLAPSIMDVTIGPEVDMKVML
jgi:hypothetical protein